MKTTKKLLKTLLMSLMLVSCLGANAMAEEGVTDSGNMNVNLDLQTTFTWQIPQGITIDQSTLKGSRSLGGGGNAGDKGYAEVETRDARREADASKILNPHKFPLLIIQ